MSSPISLSWKTVASVIFAALLSTAGFVFNSMADDITAAKAQATKNEQSVAVLKTKMDAANEKLDEQREEMKDQSDKLDDIRSLLATLANR